MYFELELVSVGLCAGVADFGGQLLAQVATVYKGTENSMESKASNGEYESNVPYLWYTVELP